MAGLAALGCSTQGRGGTAQQSANQSASNGQPVNGGTFVAALQANPQSLDPQRVSATAQVSISGVMSRVFRFKTSTNPDTATDHEIEPDLGVSAESPDAITWTIKLRPDAKFQNIAPVNGHAVEAEDVKATFIRSQDPKNPNAGNLVNDRRPTASRRRTSRQSSFKLKQPYAPFRKLLGSPVYSWIFPREALAGGYDPVKVAIGSGPYTLESAQPDVAYTYKKWADYWDKSLGHVDGYKLAIIPDPQAADGSVQHAATLDELILPTQDDHPGSSAAQPEGANAQGAERQPEPALPAAWESRFDLPGHSSAAGAVDGDRSRDAGQGRLQRRVRCLRSLCPPTWASRR